MWNCGNLEFWNGATTRILKPLPIYAVRKDNQGHRVLEGVPYKYASNYC